MLGASVLRIMTSTFHLSFPRKGLLFLKKGCNYDKNLR